MDQYRIKETHYKRTDTIGTERGEWKAKNKKGNKLKTKSPDPDAKNQTKTLINSSI